MEQIFSPSTASSMIDDNVGQKEINNYPQAGLTIIGLQGLPSNRYRNLQQRF
jgi:hypothetical protein